MSENRTVFIRNIICIVISILLIIALGYLFYTVNQGEQAQNAALETMQDEAKPYEEELQELRTQLSNLENSVSYTSDEAAIMVGFVISDASNITNDIAYIEEKAQTYAFTPVLVLDCTAELSEIETVVAATDADWEIMLYASDFLTNANENVLAVLSWLESAGREHTGVYLMRSDYSSDANIQCLAEDGFVGYTVYHDTPTAGQTEDGLVYFDYSYLTTSGTTAASRLTSLYSSKSSIITIFDMASINSGELPEVYVTSLLETMRTYADYDDCAFSTVADTVERLSQVNSIEAENQAGYEAEAAQIQERIEELKEIIAEIYGEN